MAVKPSCILDESERILQHSHTEAGIRASISRSYYATYHAAKNLADNIRFPSLSDLAGRSHEKVRMYFQQVPHADKQIKLSMMKIGYTLQRLHSIRVQADYELAISLHQEDATSMLISSKECIDTIQTLEAVLKAA